MVLTLMCMVGVISVQNFLCAVKNFCTFESFLFPQIWLLELYSMPGKLNLTSMWKGFEVDRFNRSLALCSHCVGSVGLANRASVPASGIFSDK